MKYFLGLVLATITIASATPSFSGQRACGARDAIVERLGEKYGEQPTGAGLSHSNSILEIFASEKTGTWTILMTTASGQTCLIAAGEYWDGAPALLTKSGQPT